MPLAMIQQPNGSLILAFAKGIVKTITDTEIIKKVKLAISENKSDDDLLIIIDPSIAIGMHPSGLFGVKDGAVYVKGEILPECLSTRILAFVEEKLPFEPLIKFWENCKLNPNPRTRTDLYKFLEHNGIPITTDGHFIAYRAVRNDYKDKYTGTIDNSVGQIVKMDREKVNSDPTQTCSHGLHASSYDYARSSYGSNVGLENGDRLMEIKISPLDVCAIPIDYNMSKMRVCKYEVIAENKDGVLRCQIYDQENLENDEDVLDNGNQFNDDDDCVMANPSNKINTSHNWKYQKRDSNGRFVKA